MNRFGSMDYESDERVLREFKSNEYDNIDLTTQTNVQMGTMNTSGVSILTLFMERGPITGHSYQPRINFRSLDPMYLNRNHKNKQGGVTGPMRLSHLNGAKEDGSAFDGTSNISLLPYQVFEGDIESQGDGLSPLFTHSRLKVGLEDGFSNSGYGRMVRRMAGFVSGEAFTGALEFFGLKWIGSDGEVVSSTPQQDYPPSLKELIGFASLFKDYSLQSSKQFKKFLKDFQLERIYEYDDKDSLVNNTWYFGQFMRSCIQLRFAVFDGQHRMALMSYFVTGIFDIRNTQFLDRSKSFDDVFNSEDNSKKFKWDDAQVWGPLKVNIGYAVYPLEPKEDPR